MFYFKKQKKGNCQKRSASQQQSRLCSSAVPLLAKWVSHTSVDVCQSGSICLRLESLRDFCVFVDLNACVLPTGKVVIGSPEIKRHRETRCSKMMHRTEPFLKCAVFPALIVSSSCCQSFSKDKSYRLTFLKVNYVSAFAPMRQFLLFLNVQLQFQTLAAS